jgi:hypothetical protein
VAGTGGDAGLQSESLLQTSAGTLNARPAVPHCGTVTYAPGGDATDGRMKRKPAAEGEAHVAEGDTPGLPLRRGAPRELAARSPWRPKQARHATPLQTRGRLKARSGSGRGAVRRGQRQAPNGRGKGGRPRCRARLQGAARGQTCACEKGMVSRTQPGRRAGWTWLASQWLSKGSLIHAPRSWCLLGSRPAVLHCKAMSPSHLAA